MYVRTQSISCRIIFSRVFATFWGGRGVIVFVFVEKTHTYNIKCLPGTFLKLLFLYFRAWFDY